MKMLRTCSKIRFTIRNNTNGIVKIFDSVTCKAKLRLCFANIIHTHFIIRMV